MRFDRKTGNFFPEITEKELKKAEASLFKARFDAGMRMEKGDKWITVNGQHILIGVDGKIKTPNGKGKTINEAFGGGDKSTKSTKETSGSTKKTGSGKSSSAEAPTKTTSKLPEDDLKRGLLSDKARSAAVVDTKKVIALQEKVRPGDKAVRETGQAYVKKYVEPIKNHMTSSPVGTLINLTQTVKQTDASGRGSAYKSVGYVWEKTGKTSWMRTSFSSNGTSQKTLDTSDKTAEELISDIRHRKYSL